MIRTLAFLAAALLCVASPASAADNFVVKDGAGTTMTKRSKDVGGGVQADANVSLNSSFAVIDPATSQLQQSTLTALGSPFQAGGAIANTTFGAKLQDATGSAFGTAANPIAVDAVIRGATTDTGAVITTAGTAQTLIAANAARRGFAIQNQSTGTCYISGQATATQDYHSLQLTAGAYYESKDSHVGTGAISIVCSVASAAIYARAW